MEVSHLGNFEPNLTKSLRSLIAEYIKTTSNIELITNLSLDQYIITSKKGLLFPLINRNNSLSNCLIFSIID
ncbi:hypothetical protein WFZ85_09775 [Flavobacterium sp. j3]|uniref:Uncharacterized protein n=1 Tax=Flavobacterium aureirubrum TaxID=3133147 RepID=A0ABU9N5V9_9FLAO